MEIVESNAEIWATLTDQVKTYATQFLNLSKTSTEKTIDMCEVLFNAKNSLEFRDFDNLCLAVGYEGWDASAIKKYVRIGACADQFRPYLDRLPNSWTTLYQITQLEPDLFNKAIEEGKITSATLGKDILLIKQNRTEEKEPDPRINIIFDNDVNKELIEAVCKELEALKIDFKFAIQLNKMAKDMLDNDGTNYGKT
jgi:hypothetical protein